MLDLAPLAALVGPTHCLTDATEMAPFCKDWRGRYQGEVDAVLRPAHTEEVAKILAYCYTHGIHIIPQGGNTGLCGGAAPTQHRPAIIVSLGRLHQIRQLDDDNRTLTAEAGCTLASIQAAATAQGLLFPLSLASEGSCQLGGNLSTNAGGVQVLRYGNMRELTLGLEVVLPDGRIMNTLSGLRKDNTGLDLKQLFIGAEGTLGIITAATLKLFPAPQRQATAFVALRSAAEATTLLAAAHRSFGDRLTAYELISDTCLQLVTKHLPNAHSPFATASPWYCLLELSDTWAASPLEDMLVDFLGNAPALLDATVAQSLAQRQALWTLRESISEAQKADGLSIKHDISVPVSAIDTFIEETGRILTEWQPELRLQVFGHLGDGNLHFNVGKTPACPLDLIALEPDINQRVYDQVKRYQGSISAEHGIGQLKHQTLLHYADPVKLAVMQQIKQALDPLCLMNPGKVYASSCL